VQDELYVLLKEKATADGKHMNVIVAEALQAYFSPG